MHSLDFLLCGQLYFSHDCIIWWLNLFGLFWYWQHIRNQILSTAIVAMGNAPTSSCTPTSLQPMQENKGETSLVACVPSLLTNPIVICCTVTTVGNDVANPMHPCINYDCHLALKSSLHFISTVSIHTINLFVPLDSTMTDKDVHMQQAHQELTVPIKQDICNTEANWQPSALLSTPLPLWLNLLTKKDLDIISNCKTFTILHTCLLTLPRIRYLHSWKRTDILVTRLLKK